MKTLSWGLGVLLSALLAVSAAADTKISQFPPATALQGNELLAGVQGGQNVAVTPQQVAAFSVGVIQATATGTNSIVLTTTKQSISAYSNLQLISFIAANTSTNVVTLQIGALAALPLFNSADIQANANDVTVGTTYLVTFNQNLNSGSGGFIILNATPTAATSVPSGTVVPFAGASAPSGWVFANGQAISRSGNPGLFNAIGTTYGAGDGSTTFNVPDMRGRAPFGVDNMGGAGAAGRLGGNSSTGGISGSAVLAATGGAQTHVQTVAEIATHNHTASSSFSASNSVNAFDGSGQFTIGFSGRLDATASVDASFTPAGSVSTTVNNQGSSTPFNITPPALVLNYIIKT